MTERGTERACALGARFVFDVGAGSDSDCARKAPWDIATAAPSSECGTAQTLGTWIDVEACVGFERTCEREDRPSVQPSMRTSRSAARRDVSKNAQLARLLQRCACEGLLVSHRMAERVLREEGGHVAMAMVGLRRCARTHWRAQHPDEFSPLC